MTMTTGLAYDLNVTWDHSADETLEIDRSEGLQLVRQFLFAEISLISFDQPTESASSFLGGNSRYSPSYLSLFDHNLDSISGSSTNSSDFDPNILTNYSPTSIWDQSALSCVSDHSNWSSSQQITTNDFFGFNHCGTSQGQSFPTKHASSRDDSAGAACESWQSIPHRHIADVGYQESNEFTLEELNQIEDSKFASVVAFPASPTDVRPYLLRSTEPTRLQSQGSDSDISKNLSPDTERTLLSSPVSSDDRSPISRKSIIERMDPPCKKSPVRANITHRAVEKRYRSKLDSKMIELQQCVPILDIKTKIEDDCEGPDPTSATSPKHDGKLPKGLILERAVAYIRSLEARASEQGVRVELLERRLAVLQRIALDKKNLAGLGLVTADRKDKTRPELKQSPSTPHAVSLSSTRGIKSLNDVSSQLALDADLKGSRSKVEQEHSSDFEMDGVSRPAKHRKVSRNQTTRVAVSSLVQLVALERIQ